MYKVVWWFDQFSRSYEATKFWTWREWRHTLECIKYFIPGFFCIFLLILWKKNVLHSFMVVLTISHELFTNFWMIKFCLDVSDVIHANEHTEFANSGLHTNFWKLGLTPFCFVIRKDCFKQKLLLWLHVPSNENLISCTLKIFLFFFRIKYHFDI